MTAQSHRTGVRLSHFHSCGGEEQHTSLLSALYYSCSAPPEPLPISPVPLSPSSTAILSKFCITLTPSVSALAASTALRKVRPTATTPSMPPQNWSLEKKSRFKRTARTSTGAPLQTCSC